MYQSCRAVLLSVNSTWVNHHRSIIPILVINCHPIVLITAITAQYIGDGLSAHFSTQLKLHGLLQARTLATKLRVTLQIQFCIPSLLSLLFGVRMGFRVIT